MFNVLAINCKWVLITFSLVYYRIIDLNSSQDVTGEQQTTFFRLSSDKKG